MEREEITENRRRVYRQWFSVFIGGTAAVGFAATAGWLATYLPTHWGTDYGKFALGLLLIAALLGGAVLGALFIPARIIVDDDGFVAVGMRGERREVSWDEVRGWEIEVLPAFYVIRARLKRGSVVALSCLRSRNLIFSEPDEGRYSSPPPGIPRSTSRPFEELRRRWIQRRGEQRVSAEE